jgi:stage VI sporulation protein D
LEEDDFVILRGHLALTGEYRRSETAKTDEESGVAPAGHYIQVQEKENGECVFLHHFPVDIAIPRQRVMNLDELFVEVESFDYALPENSRLKIEADILVYGIDETESAHGKVEAEKDHAASASVVDKPEEAPGRQDESAVEIEVLQAEEDVLESTHRNHADGDGAEKNPDDESKEESNLFEPFMAESRAVPDSHEPHPHNGQHPSFPFPFPVFPEMDMDELAMRAKKFFKDMEKISESSSSAESPGIAESSVHESAGKLSESSESKESSGKEEPKTKEKPKKKKGKYKTMSFADFFARKDESPAKLKVCLVQQGDSIEKLASKYDVSVQQILRANNLDQAHQLHEGQVLYIPEKTSYRK